MQTNYVLSKPTIKDIPFMQAIVKEYVLNGVILYRSDNEVANTIRSYTILKDGNELLAYGGLHIYSTDLCEIRSLVVKSGNQKKGLGKLVVDALLVEAKKLGLSKVLTLTYEGVFFSKLGFSVIDKEMVPEHKVWEDCIKCKRFPVCEEIALIKEI